MTIIKPKFLCVVMLLAFASLGIAQEPTVKVVRLPNGKLQLLQIDAAASDVDANSREVQIGDRFVFKPSSMGGDYRFHDPSDYQRRVELPKSKYAGTIVRVIAMQTPRDPETLKRILDQANKISDVALLECELDGMRVTTDRSSRSSRESVGMFAMMNNVVPLADVEAARAKARAVAQPMRDTFKGKTLWFRQLALTTDQGTINIPTYSPVKVIDVLAPDVIDSYDSREPKFILQTASGAQGWTQFVRDPAPGYLYARDPRQMFPARVWTYIERSKVFVGMTKDQALASWGMPERVNKTLTRGGVSEQWVYGLTTYLYFTNNRLTAAQN